MNRLWPIVLCLGCTPPLPGDRSEVTLRLGAFTVPPGGERYVCQSFANPLGPGEAAVARFDSQLTAGGHHMLVFFDTGGDTALEDCSGSEFAAGPYGTQQLDDSLQYPQAVAATLPAGTGLRIQAHFLNSTQQALSPSVSLKLTRAPTGFTQPAAVLFMSNLDLHVDAGATGAVAQKTCTLPWDVNLIQSTGHMHRHGTSFTAGAAGKTLFSSTAWSDVPSQLYDPPLALGAGTDVTFACSYDNPGGTPLVYGPSAQTDEMCIFSAQFFPAPFGGWSCF